MTPFYMCKHTITFEHIKILKKNPVIFTSKNSDTKYKHQLSNGIIITCVSSQCVQIQVRATISVVNTLEDDLLRCKQEKNTIFLCVCAVVFCCCCCFCFFFWGGGGHNFSLFFFISWGGVFFIFWGVGMGYPVFSSTEPKAHKVSLFIVYQSSRRPSVRSHFQT